MDFLTKSNSLYNQTQDWNDALAGGSLILFALIFLPLYVLIAIVLYRKSQVITGFRYLFSASVPGMLLLLNYAFIPGIIIWFNIHFPKSGRRIFQAYLDWVWFSMCYHFPLVAWSRFVAVYRPFQFRTQTVFSTYGSCSLCYILGLTQSVTMYFQPWYVTFYYEPSAYGLVPENLKKYLQGGKLLFFIIFDSVIIAATVVLYSFAVYLLFKHNHRTQNILCSTNGNTNSNKLSVSIMVNNQNVSSSVRAETRLFLPCICNAAVFIIGQVMMTKGIGEGRWACWLVLVLFCFTAAVEPILLLIFSHVIRESALEILCKLFGQHLNITGCVASTTNVKPFVYDDACSEMRTPIAAQKTKKAFFVKVNKLDVTSFQMRLSR